MTLKAAVLDHMQTLHSTAYAPFVLSLHYDISETLFRVNYSPMHLIELWMMAALMN